MNSKFFTVNLGKTTAYIIVPASYKKQKNYKWVIYHSGGGEWGCVITHRWNEKSGIIDKLLKNDFIVCSVSVGPAHWGNPKTGKAYKALYKYVRSNFTVSKKACLLAQSMGGLTSLPWAAKNPGTVKCLYGIYPLFDLEGIIKLKKQFRVSVAQAWDTTPKLIFSKVKKLNPVNMLDLAVKSKIPVMQRHGLVDKVVLYKQNAADFAARYRTAGGNLKLITLKKYGHETYRGFFNPGEIVKFFLSC